MTDKLLLLDEAMDLTVGVTADTINFKHSFPDKGGTPRRAEMHFTGNGDIAGAGPATFQIEHSEDNVGWNVAASFSVPAIESLAKNEVVKVPLPSQRLRQFVRGSVVTAATGTMYVDIVAG